MLDLKQRQTTAIKVCVLPGVRFADPVWFSAISASGPAPFRFFGERRSKIGWFTPRENARSVAEALARAGQQAPLLAQPDEPDWFQVVLSAKQPIFKMATGVLGAFIRELRVEVHGELALHAFCNGFLPFFQER